MNELLELIKQHLTAAGFGGGALLIAVIATMPVKPPGWMQKAFSPEMWEWMREALQTVIPTRRPPETMAAASVVQQDTKTEVKVTK